MKKDNKEYNDKRNTAICWIVIGGLYLIVFGGLVNMIQHGFMGPKKPNTEIKAGGNDTIQSKIDYQGAVDSIKHGYHKSRGQR